MNNAGLVLLLLTAYSGFAQDRFHFRREMHATDSGWHAVAIPADMFGHLQTDYRDLRLLRIEQQDTMEVPYFIRTLQAEERLENANVQMFNRSVRDRTLYFSFRNEAGRKVNRIALHFEESEYDARLTIEGSNDQREWFTLQAGVRVLSVQEGGISYQRNAFAVPDHDFEFVRIGITSPKKLSLSRADLQYLSRKDGVVMEMPLRWTVEENEKTQRTIVNVTLQHAVPVSKMAFGVEHELDFYRRFEVEAVLDSTKTDDGWKLYYTDAVYGHLTSVDSNAFDVALMRAGKWRITIHNQDNQPLQINNVRAFYPQVEIVCKLSPGKYTLVYGNGRARQPNYDIIHFKEKVPAHVATASVSGEQSIDEPLPAARALFNSKWWLWVILLVVVGTMGFFTLKMMHGKKAGEVD